MSTSNVAMGAPWATAASPPTRMNSTPEATNRSRRVVRSACSATGGGLLTVGERLPEPQNRSKHAVILPQSIDDRHREARLHQRLVDDRRVLAAVSAFGRFRLPRHSSIQ